MSEVGFLQGTQNLTIEFYHLCLTKTIILIKNLIHSNVLEQLTDFEIHLGSEQRTVGDLIEYKVKEILCNIQNDLIKDCLPPRSRKSLEDVTIVDQDNNHFYIDTMTHNVDLDFSMPNLSSVEKLRKILLDDTKFLVYVFVGYKVENQMVNILSIETKFVWELDFSILTIGALGKGQLQIANMKKNLVFTDEGKSSWYENLKLLVKKYHDNRIKKIGKEILKWDSPI